MSDDHLEIGFPLPYCEDATAGQSRRGEKGRHSFFQFYRPCASFPANAQPISVTTPFLSRGRGVRPRPVRDRGLAIPGTRRARAQPAGRRQDGHKRLPFGCDRFHYAGRGSLLSAVPRSEHRPQGGVTRTHNGIPPFSPSGPATLSPHPRASVGSTTHASRASARVRTSGRTSQQTLDLRIRRRPRASQQTGSHAG
jgi:hypothetical protein